jgi:4-hydroxybenzoate polyprenyltransferase
MMKGAQKSMSKLTENRWYIYQKERFPIAMYFPMILAFSTSAVGYASIIRGGKIGILSLITSFITSFTVFALLRIADEHKDFEDDSKYRPYRPVPRGLVKLSELRNIGIALLIIELVFAVWLSYQLIPLLAVAWLYLLMMRKEFFCGKWLRAHPVIYMLSHMIIMPILDFYATACDFVPLGKWYIASQVLWFISSSFLDGIVIEVGRKMRAPGDEEEGVETYSKIWGRKVCTAVWLGSQAASMVCTFIATAHIGRALPAYIILPVVLVFNIVYCVKYAKSPTTKNSKGIETLSGVWAILEYCALGILPLLCY